MKITVTADDILDGARGDPNQCPIAYAVRRVVPEGTRVYVGPTRLRLTNVKQLGHRWFQLPGEAQGFVSDFDYAEPVQPFEFELEGL